jgi:hypothetical protein
MIISLQTATNYQPGWNFHSKDHMVLQRNVKRASANIAGKTTALHKFLALILILIEILLTHTHVIGTFMISAYITVSHFVSC